MFLIFKCFLIVDTVTSFSQPHEHKYLLLVYGICLLTILYILLLKL
jgi:hypothetical protein